MKPQIPFQVKKFLFSIAFSISFFVSFSQNETLTSGAFIINMSATNPNTISNGIKPYGLIYDLIRNYNVPVKWVINQNKAKDGIDFNYNGVNYSGGTFIIPAEYRSTVVNNRINYWISQGVVGATTTNNLNLNISYTIKSYPKWTLDAKNGFIAETFIKNAGITNTLYPGAYNWKDPQTLDCCDDFFVMPHADPSWSTHGRLWSWNKDCYGSIWAGCHAVSVLENMKNPANNAQQTNFLSTTGLLMYNLHTKGTPPYTNQLHTDPVAQYLGTTELAHQNGSEQIYMPLPGGAWRPTTKIITYDATQSNVPANSPGQPAIVLYGRGFGANDRGFVMYEGGHSLAKGTTNDVAAQRAFWNFSFFQLTIKTPSISVLGLSSVSEINAGSTIHGLSASASSPVSGVTYTYQWTSSCGGTFSNPTGTSTSYTAPMGGTTNCIITCKVKDNCGRSTFQSFPVKIIGVAPPITVNDDLFIDPACTNTNFTKNVLLNDTEPDGQSMILTNVSGAINGTLSFLPNGNISYSPAIGFTGQETIIYTVCDSSQPTPLCTSGILTITVGNQNNVPNVVNDSYTIQEDEIGIFNVLSNDLPLVGGQLYIIGIGSAPANGKVSVNTNNTITYVPNADFSGNDQFTYRLVNSLGYQTTGTVTVSVSNDNCDGGTRQTTAGTNGVITYTPDADAEIDSIATLNNYGASTSLIVHANSGAQPTRSLLQFNLSSIPSGSTITNSRLRMVRTGGTTTSQNVGVYNVTKNWNEGTLNSSSNSQISNGVTWYTTNFSQQWLSPGGDYNNTNASITNVSTASGGINSTSTYEWNITNMTQIWLNNPIENKGLLVKDVTEISGDNKTFASKENASVNDRPILRVTYSPAGGGSDVTVDIQVAQDAYIYENITSKVFGNGASFNVLVNAALPQRILMRYPIKTSDIPVGSIIDSANLELTRTNGNGSLNIAAYQVTNSWNEAAGNNKANTVSLNGATWNQRNYTTNWNTIGGDFISTYGAQTMVDNQTSKYRWNVKDIVQNWTKNSPDSNFGFLIKAVNETSNTSLTFASRENSTSSNRPKLNIYYRTPGGCGPIPSRAPMTMPDTVKLTLGGSININVAANDSYSPNANLNYTIIAAPLYGNATINAAGILTYTTSGTYNGVVKLTYRVSESTTGLNDDANVYIVVNNAPLTAVDDVPVSMLSGLNQTINVKSNDSDPEGNLSNAIVNIISTPNNGTATVNVSGNIVYVPGEGFTGNDTLTYTICEPATSCESSYCDTAKIVLNVMNRQPEATNDSLTILPCLNATINLLANDTDAEGQVLNVNNISSLSNPASGTLVNNGDGTISFTPATGYSGTVTLSYSLTDNGIPVLSSNSATVSITVVNPVNSAPIATNDDETTLVNESLFTNVTDNDYDPEKQELTLPVITVQPLHGTATVNTNNGLIEYIPQTGYTGTDELTYRICDKVIDENNCSSTPTMCATAKLNITINAVPPPYVEPIMGYNTMVTGSSLILENITPGGIWSSSNTSIISVDDFGVVTGIRTGTADILYTVSSPYGSTTVLKTITVMHSTGSSGFAGGLESKSLGEAYATRVYEHVTTNQSGLVDYGTTPVFKPVKNNMIGVLSRTYGLQLNQFFPDATVIGNNIIPYVTTPGDLVYLTNAKAALAVDYTYNGENKAVAFATKTYDYVYTHTKPVCDRLKGAVLLDVDSIKIKQFNFIQYYLLQTNGIKEYAISFTVGQSAGNDNLTIQSEWMTDEYAQLDTLYNFQIWSPDQNTVNRMVESIISRFESQKPLIQPIGFNIPKAYISSMNRVDSNQLQLSIDIINTTAETQGIIYISGKQNEKADFKPMTPVQVTLTPFGKTNKILLLKDLAEAELKLFVNGSKEDFVYTNDGTWNVYAPTGSTVTNFNIINDTIQPLKSEKRLFRNITLSAKTSDYISVYRVLRGGAEVENLTGYNFLKFTATGEGKVRIRIIKKSITNYDNQYEHLITLSGNKDYVIPVSAFTSKGFADKIELNDATIVSYTFEAEKPNTTIQASLKNVRFTKYNNEALEATQIVISPNPVTDKIHFIFKSEKQEPTTLKIVELGTGRVVYNTLITAIAGLNDITIPAPRNLSSGMYVIKLASEQTNYQSKIVMIKLK